MKTNRDRHHCSKSFNFCKNSDLPQHSSCLLTSMKFDKHKKNMLEQVFFAGSLSQLTPFTFLIKVTVLKP